MLTIEEIKKAVTPICEKYGVEKMWLFGSYARGEADDKSDVDLIVDGGDSPKLRGFAWGGLYADIREALGVELDVLSRRGTRQKFLNKIAKDEVLLYER
ncbi:MAG: nucleotidyltransferase domain-containing protein [Selenomonadaceae bacterium]|nr:nucleotidyltransferase domain-containing protein [Selenomonadaceae bacterium]